MELILWVVALALAVANARVTLLVARSPAYTRGQKTAQIFCIWLLPLLGVVVAWVILKDDIADRPENPHADDDDFKTIGSDARGSYGSPD
jgi:hypothetical protein